jgi:preprotein translocase subunit SecG
MQLLLVVAEAILAVWFFVTVLVLASYRRQTRRSA